MADIGIEWAVVTNMPATDWGTGSVGSAIKVRYDMPDMEMDGHVHTIPFEAIGNLQMENDEDDPAVCVDFFIREAATSLGYSVARSKQRAPAQDPRPLVASGRQTTQRLLAEAALTTAADGTDERLGLSRPLTTHAMWFDRSEYVMDAVSMRLGKSGLRGMEGLPKVRDRVQLRQTRGDELLTVPDYHRVVTEGQAWDDLTGLLAESAQKLARQRAVSFDRRFRDQINQAVGHRRVMLGL